MPKKGERSSFISFSVIASIRLAAFPRKHWHGKDCGGGACAQQEAVQPAGREPLTEAAHDYLITLFMFLIELLSENAEGENGRRRGIALPERVPDLLSSSVNNLE